MPESLASSTGSTHLLRLSLGAICQSRDSAIVSVYSDASPQLSQPLGTSEYWLRVQLRVFAWSENAVIDTWFGFYEFFLIFESMC